MKALTVLQPWASLISLGAKRYETRSWGTPYRGLIAIHAGKQLAPWQRSMTACDGYLRQPLAIAGMPYACDLPLGAIVAVVVIAACTGADRLVLDLSVEELARGDFTPGRFAWELRDVIRLPRPVECRGAQRIWEVPESVAVAVRSQLPGVLI